MDGRGWEEEQEEGSGREGKGGWGWRLRKRCRADMGEQRKTGATLNNSNMLQS